MSGDEGSPPERWGLSRALLALLVISSCLLAGSAALAGGREAGPVQLTSRLVHMRPGVIVNSTSFVSGTELPLSISTVGIVAGTKTARVANPDGQTRLSALLVPFGVIPFLRVHPAVGYPGERVTVSGSYFPPNEAVSLSWRQPPAVDVSLPAC